MPKHQGGGDTGDQTLGHISWGDVKRINEINEAERGMEPKAIKLSKTVPPSDLPNSFLPAKAEQHDFFQSCLRCKPLFDPILRSFSYDV